MGAAWSMAKPSTRLETIEEEGSVGDTEEEQN
jgi:hypothetical protein